MVRVAEQQGALIAQVIRGVLDRIDLAPAQKKLAAQAAREELMAVAAA
jgi:hypothetical protein